VAYNLGTAEGRIIIDGSGAQRGFAVATVAANAFFSVIQSKLDSVERLGESLIKVGATGGVGLGLAVKAAASFEQGLSNIRAVSGATEKEMEGIRKTALRLGKDTVFSATEAASAMEALIKAGVSTQDVMTGAADATVNLAAAGGVDLTTAAEIAANALNNFNLTGKDMKGVTDAIAGAANASAIDVNDFGFSLSQAGAVANLTGLSFQDLAVAIAEMGQAGIKGSDAGTSIKTFLTNLIPTTDKQTELFKKLGLITLDTGKSMAALASKGIKPASSSVKDINKALQEYVAKSGGSAVGTKANADQAAKLGQELGVMKNAFFDANGELKSFSEVQEVLQNAVKGMTREQKLATLETLFGSDAIRAAAVFAEEGAEGYDKMATAMGKVSAADVAATRLDNLNGSIEQLKGSFETMMITIGEVFLPIVRKFVDAITSIINIFNNLPAPVQKAIAIMIGLGSATALLTGILIKLLFVLTPLIAKMLGLAALRQIFSIFTVGFKALRGGQGVMLALAASSSRLGVVFGRFAKIGKFLFGVLVKFPKVLAALRFAWALAFGPWGVAIAAVVAAIVFAYKKFDGFRELVDRMAGAVKGFVTGAWKQLLLGIEAFKEAFAQGDVTSDGFIGFMERLGVAARQVWEALKSLADLFMREVMPVLQEAGRMIMAELGTAFQELAKVFQQNIVPAANDLADTFMTDVFPALKQLWAALQPAVVAVLKLAAAIQIGLLIALFKWAQFFISTILPVLIKFTTYLIIGVVKAITLVIKYIAFFVTGLIKFADVLIQVVVGAIKLFVDLWQFQWNLVKTIFQTVANAIIGAVKWFAQTMTSLWNSFWNGPIGQIVRAVMELIKSLIQLALTAILVIVTVGLDSLYKVWLKIWGLIQVAVAKVMQYLKPFITASLNAIKAVWTSVSNAISSVTRAAWQKIQQYIITPLQNAYNKVRSIVNSVLASIRGAWNSATSSTNSSWRSLYTTVVGWINNVLNKVRSIKGAVTGALSGAGSWLRDAGRRIIQGLLDGINSMIGSVRGALNSLTGLIPSWKGPERTDKKLLLRNGQLILQGLIEGFRREMPAVRSALQDVTRAIPADMTVRAAVTQAASGRVLGQQVPTWAQQAAQQVINNNWTVNNPVAEKTSTTTVREATRRAHIGMVA
jgi:phage-related protein